ncbi:hypothetical protein SBV1_130062 [Verrucomicrobia bacterium]|nr:hypothetical protein SBV1_130062 [Verrucomicrobiota bacterium]
MATKALARALGGGAVTPKLGEAFLVMASKKDLEVVKCLRRKIKVVTMRHCRRAGFQRH